MVCSQCGIAMSEPPKAICSHLLEPDGEHVTHHRCFTGHGTDYSLVCSVCAGYEGPAPLRGVCESCFARHERFWAEGTPVGRPEVLVRLTNVSFAHRTVTVSAPPVGRWLSVRPVSAQTASLWIGLTENGELFRIDLDRAELNLLTRIHADEVDLGKPISVHTDGHGRYAAVANTFGRRGTVVALETGARTMQLVRDDYHPEHCSFPWPSWTAMAGLSWFTPPDGTAWRFPIRLRGAR